MNDPRIEAATKEEWAERCFWAEAQRDALEASNKALVEALGASVATIEDYLAYEHDGDPWTEDARAMREMDIDDYAKDGRLTNARAALAAAKETA